MKDDYEWNNRHKMLGTLLFSYGRQRTQHEEVRMLRVMWYWPHRKPGIFNSICAIGRRLRVHLYQK